MPSITPAPIAWPRPRRGARARAKAPEEPRHREAVQEDLAGLEHGQRRQRPEQRGRDREAAPQLEPAGQDVDQRGRDHRDHQHHDAAGDELGLDEVRRDPRQRRELEPAGRRMVVPVGVRREVAVVRREGLAEVGALVVEEGRPAGDVEAVDEAGDRDQGEDRPELAGAAAVTGWWRRSRPVVPGGRPVGSGRACSCRLTRRGRGEVRAGVRRLLPAEVLADVLDRPRAAPRWPAGAGRTAC